MIYFVLCPAFQGATLLSLLLNNHSRIFSLGDTNPTRAYDQVCACGEMVSECEFWEHIRSSIHYDPNAPYPNLMQQYPVFSSNSVMNKAINTCLAYTGFWPQLPAIEKFKREYDAFREACQSWAQHSIFVDGEKNTLKFMVLASMGYPIGGLIHVIRDPRGYAYSYKKYFPSSSYADIAKSWKKQHLRIEYWSQRFMKDRIYKFRYEDSVGSPEEHMRDICKFMGLEEEDVISAPKFEAKNHGMGNKMLKTFDGQIHRDEPWLDSLSTEEQRIIVDIAEPLFTKLGYKY